MRYRLIRRKRLIVWLVPLSIARKRGWRNVKGQTAERVRDMYDATNAGFSQYGRKAGEAILNNSFGDLIRRYVPLNPERDMLRVSGQAGRHGISYDPERKVFIMKPNGGKK